ncbi:hypothetical protein [Coralliovum pocilloporae]|uniref:hypothetical protein n=1 Tax=Coralliovum pocilloporae TaxID=3066369 RepID=UPI003306FCEF
MYIENYHAVNITDKSLFYSKAAFSILAGTMFVLLTSAANSADIIEHQATADAPAVSEIGPVYEGSVWGGYLSRSGSGLNESGPPRTEIEDFPLMGAGVLLSLPVHENWLVQFELAGENAFNNSDIRGVPANDTYNGGFTGGGHVAYIHGNFLFGVFGGAGRTYFTAASANQDATQWLAGGEARYMVDKFSFAAQIGYLDTNSQNQETLADTAFVKLSAKGFFNDGRSSIGGGIGYADGTQDADNRPGAKDPTTLVMWDVTLEHQLDMLSIGDTAGSVFVSYQGVHVDENGSTGASDRVTDQGIYAGLRFRFGANQSLHQRERQTAPSLPNVHRWLGAVPAVD